MNSVHGTQAAIDGLDGVTESGLVAALFDGRPVHAANKPGRPSLTTESRAEEHN